MVGVSYRRPGNYVPVTWKPDDEQAGREAVEAVVGKPETWPAEVSDEESAEIREKYEKLTAEDETAEGGV